MASWLECERRANPAWSSTVHRVPGVRALLFSGEENKVKYVWVPVRKGVSTEAQHINDLDTAACWTNTPQLKYVRCEEDFRFCVKKYPLTSKLNMMRQFTVYWEGKDVINMTIEGLSRGLVKKAVGGVLVIKHDRLGYPENVIEKDEGLIYSIVHHVFEANVAPYNATNAMEHVNEVRG